MAVIAAAAAQEGPPKAHFHHIHLNTTDPAAAIKFYAGKFDCEQARFAGHEDAVWAQKSWLLFTAVKQAPAAEIVSAIWHFGWGAEDMPSAYQRQLDSGTKFQTVITDISDLVGKPAGSFYFAYVDGPDHALIELNTASHHRFGHVHLLSADPVAAGEWYQKHFGMAGFIGPRQPRVYRGVHVGPAASLTMDNVNIIIFPAEYARDALPDLWKDRASFEPTEGRVIDHLAFGVADLSETLARLRKDDVKITREPANIPGTRMKSAFIKGPDRIRIELVEGEARRE